MDVLNSIITSRIGLLFTGEKSGDIERSQLCLRSLSFNDPVSYERCESSSTTLANSKWRCNAHTKMADVLSSVEDCFLRLHSTFLNSSVDPLVVLDILSYLLQHYTWSQLSEFLLVPLNEIVVKSVEKCSVRLLRSAMKSSSVLPIATKQAEMPLFPEQISDWSVLMMLDLQRILRTRHITTIDCMEVLTNNLLERIEATLCDPASLTNNWLHVLDVVRICGSFIELIETSSKCDGKLQKLYNVCVKHLNSTIHYILKCPEIRQHTDVATDYILTIFRLLVTWTRISNLLSSISSTSRNPLDTTAHHNRQSVHSPVANTSDALDERIFNTSGDSLGFDRSKKEPALSKAIGQRNYERSKSVLKNQLDYEDSDIKSLHPVGDSASPAYSKFNMLYEIHQSREFKQLLEQLICNYLKSRIGVIQVAREPFNLNLFEYSIDQYDHPFVGSRHSLLIQHPMLCSSTRGPLFRQCDMTIVDLTADTSTNSWVWDQHMPSILTVQSSMSAWMDDTGSGSGLPYPAISVSKSICEFVSATVSHILPVVLCFLQSDAEIESERTNDHKSVNIKLDNSYGISTSDISKSNTPEVRQTSDFGCIITSILRSLILVLSGNPVRMSISDCPDVHPGITSQIYDLILTLNSRECNDITQHLASCISDCLLLRSLCALLSNVFRNEFNLKINFLSPSEKELFSCDILSAQMTEFTKQYDSSIRVLSEYLIDLCLQHNEDRVAELVALCQPNAESQAYLANCDHLKNLWAMLSTTCPAGLARQIMSEVCGQYLQSCVQILTTKQLLSCADRTRLQSILWFLLRFAKFCLFVCSETGSEIVGLGQLPPNINLIHSSATALVQLLVCLFMPEEIWVSVHENGFYQSMIAERSSFDFCPSNWLRFADPVMFPNPLYLLMCENSEQTSLRLEVELFAYSRHFDPIRLLSLILASNAEISLSLLKTQKLSSLQNSNSEIQIAVGVFSILFRFCSHIPEMYWFHSAVLDEFCCNGESSLSLACPTDRRVWPIWFRAILNSLNDSVTDLWNAFTKLVQQHVITDQSLSSQSLLEIAEEQGSAAVFSAHKPEIPSLWRDVFPYGNFPCGCQLPEPLHLRPQPSAENVCTENNQKLSSKCLRASNESGDGFIGSYHSFYLQLGQLREAWRELAYDIILSVPVFFSTGFQYAFGPLEKAFKQNPSSHLRGGCLCLHLLLTCLYERICKAFSDESFDPQTKVHFWQHVILWEHLCSLFHTNDGLEEQDIHLCKSRMLGHLETIRNSLNDTIPESSCQSKAGRQFQLSQYVRVIQQQNGALSDLFFMHRFFKSNIDWLRSVSDTNSTSVCEPVLDMDNHISMHLSPDFDEKSRETNWQELSHINVGLTQDLTRQLRLA